MKLNLRSVAIHIFLIVVSVAAFPHSTIAFATGFGGLEPVAQFTLRWWAWALEGAALAFALDIGLLEIARKIRDGNRSRWMLAAFVVLALFQFYLQFSFIAVHSPHQAVADGVRAEWVAATSWMLDAKIWLYPALLPIALVLFSFADSGDVPATKESTGSASTALALVPPSAHEQIAIENPNELVEIECDHQGCSWAGSYESQRGAINALTAHKRTHSVATISQNGRHS